MKKAATYRQTLVLIALTGGGLMTSCGGDNDLQQNAERSPIAFVSLVREQEVVTRADKTLGRDFVVYGYKRLGDEKLAVFDGYTISYDAGSANTSADNTHNYHYVGGGQTIKYWDFAADEYHFWGVWAATADRAQFTGFDSNVVTIPEVPIRVGEPAPADEVLFSQLVVRCPVSADVVQFAFKRPYAKIRIQFYTTETIASSNDNIELTDISLSPNPDAEAPLVNKIFAKGDVVVTYPGVMDYCAGNARETVTVANLQLPKDELVFDAVTIQPGQGVSINTAVTAYVDGYEGLCLLPMGEKNPDFTLKLTINGDDEPRTATVPSAYMQWRPNVLYTYTFKINGTSRNVEFYDVKVDPWEYGGSQEEEDWKNW